MTRMPDPVLSRIPLSAAGILALAMLLGHNPTALAADAVPPPPTPAADLPDDANVEVMTRGPVHEAYAMPVTNGRTTGLLVPKRPPEPVEEAPPEVMPDDERASWISGYWSWDDDRKDYIWVSGVWRVPPPGYQWVPGYWQDAGGSWQWVSGFWMADATDEVEYLPEPPESLEQGPAIAAPSVDYFWVPGSWRWRGLRYVWVPGYWAASRPDWVWVSPSYYWSPRGWIYCAGYWDYPLARRGLLFSPVYFVRPVAFYRPAVCVDLDLLTFSLFCRPSYCHYYFGDYYASSYVSLGIRPWFEFYGPRYGYDPLFCYYRSYYHRHGNPHWEHNLRGWHDYYHRHPEHRLPHTLAEQRKLLSDPGVHKRPDVRQIAISRSVADLKKGSSAMAKVRPVSANQQIEIQQKTREVSKFKSERHHLEAQAAAGRGKSIGATAAGPKQPEKVGLGKLPGFQATRHLDASEMQGRAGAAKALGQTTHTSPALKQADGIQSDHAKHFTPRGDSGKRESVSDGPSIQPAQPIVPNIETPVRKSQTYGMPAIQDKPTPKAIRSTQPAVPNIQTYDRKGQTYRTPATKDGSSLKANGSSQPSHLSRPPASRSGGGTSSGSSAPRSNYNPDRGHGGGRSSKR